MTAYRIITDHNELDNAGNVDHERLDKLVNQTKLLVVSGSPGSDPPNHRTLIAGSGIDLIDGGPGGNLTVKVADNTIFEGHEKLLQFIHFVEGPGNGFSISPFRERVGYPFVERLTWWTGSDKTKRVFQTELTRSVGSFLVTTASYKLFDSSGNLVKTAIDTITYLSGVFESTRTRTFT